MKKYIAFLVILSICFPCHSIKGLAIFITYFNIENNNKSSELTSNQQNCENRFQCKDTAQCISLDKICDGKIDCFDGSDELKSTCAKQRCPSYLFRCDYGGCIEMNKKCNGIRDCRDNSDEKRCLTKRKITINKCGSGKFRCRNGECIDTDYVCDGKANCSDQSDETAKLCNPMYCPGYTFKCTYGACVDVTARCNGISDCIDSSDEENCHFISLSKEHRRGPFGLFQNNTM